MSLRFGYAVMREIHPNHSLVRNLQTGTVFMPTSIQAVAGGRLQHKADSLIVTNSPAPVYFNIKGLKAAPQAGANPFINITVPFDNLGQAAQTQQLEVVA